MEPESQSLAQWNECRRVYSKPTICLRQQRHRSEKRNPAMFWYDVRPGDADYRVLVEIVAW